MKLTRESRTFVLLLESDALQRFPQLSDGVDAAALQRLIEIATSGRLIDRLRALAIAAYPTDLFSGSARYKKPIANTLADGQGLEFLFEVSPEALRLWRTSSPPLREAVLKHIDELRKRAAKWPQRGKLRSSPALREALKGCLDRLDALYQAVKEKKRTYEVRVILGFASDTESQLAVDRLLYRDRPLLLSAYYDTQSPEESGLLQAHLSEVLGVFYVWARREQLHEPATYTWWRQPLRIRYSIETGGQAFIRAKMTVPNVRPGNSAPWDYDGPVIVRDSTITLLLESRSTLRQDFFNVIVGHPDLIEGSSYVSTGRYLTTAQDSAQTVITGRVVLEQIARRQRHVSASAPEAHETMQGHASVFHEKEPEFMRAEELWEALRKRPKGDTSSD
ncbi:hypothetical protein D621_21560 [beta proteobacterium AAP51]|nr:hypothetical protein D621_21560 [beta proteobacterium AAP51]